METRSCLWTLLFCSHRWAQGCTTHSFVTESVLVISGYLGKVALQEIVDVRQTQRLWKLPELECRGSAASHNLQSTRSPEQHAVRPLQRQILQQG